MSLGYEGLPEGLRDKCEAVLERLSRIVRDRSGLRVSNLGIVATTEEATQANAALKNREPSIVLVVPFNGARADLQWRIVDGLEAPVLVWARPWHRSHPTSFRPIDSVVESNAIGSQAISNMLMRRSRHFTVIESTSLTERMVAWIRAVHLARTFATMNFALIGGLFEGMLDVQFDTMRFQEHFGASWHEKMPASRRVGRRQPSALPLDPSLSSDALMRSKALDVALRQTADRFDAVAVNCHSGAIAYSVEFGVTACLGVSRLTSRGIPAACAGDMSTAVAMLIASRLSGASQYVEVDSTDVRRKAILLSNGGELDKRMAVRDTARVLPNQFFSGLAGRGAALDGVIRPGPATLVAFTPTEHGWRLVTMEGSVLGDRLAGFEVPHAFFRAATDMLGAAARYAAAGVPHHSALAAGHIGEASGILSELLNIEHVSI
jgi:L-arabinose isomerase